MILHAAGKQGEHVRQPLFQSPETDEHFNFETSLLLRKHSLVEDGSDKAQRLNDTRTSFTPAIQHQPGPESLAQVAMRACGLGE